MNYITELQNFIVDHPNDWKELLEQKPYCLKIKEEDNLILFKYNQIDSDFSLKIVREARGIILEKDTLRVVSRKFDKFMNYNQPNCDNVDFNNSCIWDKIDGSILGVWYYNGKWRVSTNGTINAFACTLPYVSIYDTPNIQTFGDLFLHVIELNKYTELQKAMNGQECSLDKNCTYIFEIVSEYNRVVVNYPHPDLFHLGVRNNITGDESLVDIGVQHPQKFSFKNIDDVIRRAKTLSCDEEGFVVCDNQFRRCKIKGDTYLQLHRLKGESIPTEKRILELILINEGEELINYFPEYKPIYERVEDLYEKFIEKVEREVDYIFSMEYDDRKSFAAEASKLTCPAFIFQVYDHKWSAGDFRGFCGEMRIESLLNYIKEEE